MIKKMASFLAMLFIVQSVFSQSISGYYSRAAGTSGKSLKTALYEIVKDHRQRSYGDLWQDFKKTDCRPDGKVWDMYSNVTSYTLGGSEQGASASAEGVAYNREHSFPKSWFSEGYPMYTDLFHLYPVDAYINSMRSNLPFGETSHPKKTSKNGWSKWGPSSVSGYSGTVFEPNDEYKGDFARTYFYMATRYENVIAEWTTKKGEVFPMLNRTSYPAFSDWALSMLLRWAKEDPVSQKEIDRNNAVYEIQHNRNPYIDYPGLEQYVWGDKTQTVFDPENYEGNGITPGPEDKEVAAPVFSIADGVVAEGTEIVISCATGGASIYYSINEGPWQTHVAPVTFVVCEDMTVETYAQVGNQKSATVYADYSVAASPGTGHEVYVSVSAPGDLVIGAKYLIVCEEKGVAMAEANPKDYRNGVSVAIKNGEISTETSAVGLPYVLTLGGSSAGYTFYDAASKTYLGLTSDKNKLFELTENKGVETQWNISVAGKDLQIFNMKYPERLINYNAGSPRFAAYKTTSGQTAVTLYKQTKTAGILYPNMSEGKVNVYTMGGQLLFDSIKAEDALKVLSRGIYVVGGTKVIVR